MINDQLKYFLYARKSSEAEDRQMASIDAQIDELTELAQKEGIEIVHTFTESKTAKTPGRSAYNDMIARIKIGEANGIICWKLNRLSRNPVDSGEISWLLQEEVIKHIFTPGHSYYPADNVLIMTVEQGMANQFIRELSTDTKRGLKNKAKQGWYPGPALLGYKNTPDKEKGMKIIETDKERFDLVYKMFKMVLKQHHSATKILEIATTEWGLTRPNGKPLSNSTWFKMLHHPFYYGYFDYNGTRYKGKHTPMLTKQEFNQIQQILGVKRPDKPHRHSFPFTGLITCGECGKTITAEHKYKHQKNGKVRHYVYYHCTSPNKKICSQGVTNQNNIHDQLSKFIETIEIPSDLTKWALKVLHEKHKDELISKEQIIKNAKKQIKKCELKIDALIDMRTNGELTEDEFKRKKEQIKNQKCTLEETMLDTTNSENEWLEKVEKHFKLAEVIKEKFDTANNDLVKKGLIRELCSNLSLKDQKINARANYLFSEIQKLTTEANRHNLHVRTSDNRLSKRKNAPSYDTFPALLRESDSNRRPIG